MKCPHCQSKKTVKNGKARLKDQRKRQKYLGRSCGKRFNERKNTLMARLRTVPEIVSAALRRRCSAYCRRQNLYAKKLPGLQRIMDVQRLIPNWVRPDWGLEKDTTPAMKMGFCSRPLRIMEILTSRGFDDTPF